MMEITIDASEISGFSDFLVQFPKVTPKALSIAINDTMRDVVIPEGRKLMREQIDFPSGYLERSDRFTVEEYSSPSSLIGWVAGRDRPTSLRQFATGTGPDPVRGQPWVPVQSIEVHPGAVKSVLSGVKGKMFLIPLKKGQSWGNVGLAIRLRPGEKVENIREYTPMEIFKNVYVLYGPSVDQVFKSVAVELMPEVASYMTQEFYRQMDRLLGGVNFAV